MEEKRKPLTGKEQDELRLTAENVVAVQIARQILESGPVEEMTEGEKKEFERMNQIVKFASDLLENPDFSPGEDTALGAAAESWNAFLHLFMRSILNECGNVRRKIENVYNEMQSEAESSGGEDN